MAVQRDPITGEVLATPDNLHEIERQLMAGLAAVGIMASPAQVAASRQLAAYPQPYITFSDVLYDPRTDFSTALYKVGSIPAGVNYNRLLQDNVARHLSYYLNLPVRTFAKPGWGIGFDVALTGNPESFLPLAERLAQLQKAQIAAEVQEEAKQLPTGPSSLPRRIEFLEFMGDLANITQDKALPEFSFSFGIGTTPDGPRPLVLTIQDLMHVLVGAATKSGKTNMFNVALTQLIMNNSPRRLRLVLADLKEGAGFAPYAVAGIPHLYNNIGKDGCGVVETVAELVPALDMLLAEMKNRLNYIKGRASDIDHFNRLVREGKLRGEKEFPIILFVLDEINAAIAQERIALAQLKQRGGNSQDAKPVILSQFDMLSLQARAAGIYCWFGSQNPDRRSVSDTLLLNTATRIALNVDDWPTLSFIMGKATREFLSVPPRGRGRGLIRTDELDRMTYLQVPVLDYEFWTGILTEIGNDQKLATERDQIYLLRPNQNPAPAPVAAPAVPVPAQPVPTAVMMQSPSELAGCTRALVRRLLLRALYRVDGKQRLFSVPDIRFWLAEDFDDVMTDNNGVMPDAKSCSNLVAALRQLGLLDQTDHLAAQLRTDRDVDNALSKFFSK